MAIRLRNLTVLYDMRINLNPTPPSGQICRPPDSLYDCTDGTIEFPGTSIPLDC